MTLLDDAPEPCFGDRRWFCGAYFEDDHNPDCPWLRMSKIVATKIVAALEAAERPSDRTLRS